MMATLSDKRFKVEVPGSGWVWVVPEEDVEEFISRLKEEFKNSDDLNYRDECEEHFNEIIHGLKGGGLA